MADFAHLHLAQEGRVLTASIDRPEALNALNEALLRELEAFAREAAARDELGAVVVTGRGRAFVAGADIRAMRAMDASEARAFGELGHAVMNAIAAIPVPVIAAVNGFALGGGLELAAACDIIYASAKAKFGLPEVGLGLIPGFGGTQRVPRLIGIQAARELIYTGEMIGAEEAAMLGLVRRIYAPDELLSKAQERARTIAERGPRAVRAAKRAVEAGRDAALADGLGGEIDAFGALFGAEEAREGMDAHVEKRAPRWSGAGGSP